MKTARRIRFRFSVARRVGVGLLGLAWSATLGWADILNTAAVHYWDSTGAPHSGVSNTIVITTSPASSSTGQPTASGLIAVRVFPNPWRSDRHNGFPVTFDHLIGYATIKIFTVSGRLVKTLNTSAGSMTWDLTNDSGESVASGLYLYLITNNQNDIARGKLAIIR